MKRPLTSQFRQALYQDALAVMRAHYARSGLRLEEVAREVATSERQLQRVFQEIGDAGFRTTLRRVRMDAAKRLLAKQPTLPIREVARRVGYTQPAQFAKTFRSEVGVSPAEYRAQLAG